MGIWNLTIQNPKHPKSVLFEDRISNSPVFKGLGSSLSPNHLKTKPFTIPTFIFKFKMISDKIAAICQNLKKLGHFKIWTICKPSTILTIQNLHQSGFWIPAVMDHYLFLKVDGSDGLYFTHNQTWENNSTWSQYSKNIWYSANTWVE